MIELINSDKYVTSEPKKEYRLVKYEYEDGLEWFAIEVKQKLFFGLVYRWKTYRKMSDWVDQKDAESILSMLENPPQKAKKTILTA